MACSDGGAEFCLAGLAFSRPALKEIVQKPPGIVGQRLSILFHHDLERANRPVVLETHDPNAGRRIAGGAKGEHADAESAFHKLHEQMLIVSLKTFPKMQASF